MNTHSTLTKGTQSIKITTVKTKAQPDKEPDLYDLITNNNPLIAHIQNEYYCQYNYEIEDNCGMRQYSSEYWERRYLAELNSSMRLDNRIFAQRFKKYHSKAQSNNSKSQFKGRA